MAKSDSIVQAIPNNPTPPVIIHQDNSVFPTTLILDETNYSLWSQLMEMCIGARNKAGYLTGEAKKPAPEDPTFATWINENQREIDHKTTSHEGTVEGVVYLHSAMARLRNRSKQSTGKSSNHVCSHCGESGHTKQRCYEIIGYPEWWDFSKKPRKKIAGKVMVTNEVQSNVEDKLQPTTNFAYPGIVGKANESSATSKKGTWIIDTGASDHMIRDSDQLQFIRPSSQSVISTANGSTSPIGEGSVILSKTLTLNSVLVVLSLEYNLLSVSQITSTLAGTVTF
ncbi:hypothetical protein REPUB_Repub20aG0016600 [Reevesia pubescens]